MTKMLNEIKSQPAVLRGIEAKNKSVLEAIAKNVEKKNVSNVVFAARGSSNNACVYFKYLCEVFAGLPVASAAPSVVTMYGGKLNMKNNLVIGVSQSGKAADAIAVLETARKQGAVTVAVTNYEDSPMAKAAEFHVFLNAGEEESVAATKTFTAQFFALGLIAAYISKNNDLLTQLRSVPDGVDGVLASEEEITKFAEIMKDVKDCFTLARGMNYAAALESALKLQETTYTRAKAFAASDFHHGPFAMVDEKTFLLMFIPAGESFKDCLDLYNKCKNVNAQILVFSDSEDLYSPFTVKIPAGTDVQTPFYNVVAAQLLANALSVLRGINPDAPRGLNKITVTI